MRLSPKVILLVLSVLLVSMSLLSIPLYWYSRAALDEELGEQLKRISAIVSYSLDKDMIRTLNEEPGLQGIRRHVEGALTGFAVSGIEGLTLYKQDGSILAQEQKLQKHIARLSPALPGLLTLENDIDPVVSEIYELDDGRHVKAVALPLNLGANEKVILVVWAGASYMGIIQQMQGSLLWIFLAAVVVAVALTLVFSQSLIRPVRALSQYAGAIQSNINSEPVFLNRSDEFGELNQSLVEMHEEIKKQEESARQLLAGIAHEIKNPLGGMEIYSGLLEDELTQLASQEGQDADSYLRKIRVELQHLKQIVQEYLDYARPLKSVIESVKLSEIFENVQALLKPELDTQNQSITMTGDARLLADRSKLHRVFLNLLQNGLTAAGKNAQLKITIESDRSTVNIYFEDNGSGIPEADQERIFEPYFSTHDRGYGLGLSIVRSIVGELSGTIVVQKSSETGTIFKVSLPKKEVLEK